MIKLFVTLCLISKAYTADKRSLLDQDSAASRSQIMTALENNFDDTGPGAKTREYAYKTFNTLEEALVNHLNDPDTLLPKFEKEVAVRQLLRQHSVESSPSLTGQYKRYNKPIVGFSQRPTFSPFNEHKKLLDFRSLLPSNAVVKNFYSQDGPGNYPRYQSVRKNPMNVAHYTKDPDVAEAREEFNHNPQYSYSYGVHDKHTGDSKSAHETRDGEVVRGFYTFLDADGKQRTVHYTADDDNGFRATVQTSHTNGQ